MKRVMTAVVLLLSMAHIGSNDVFFDGKAGPYQVHLRVFPPTVVPGIAWAYVRTSEPDIDSIAVKPVYWRAGEKGAPPAERAVAVKGEPGLFAQKMWMMSRGSYSVEVSVFGKRGMATASIPVMALATKRLELGRPFALMLAGFGIVLFAGLVAIVRAAASDSLVEPDRAPHNGDRRRGSLAAAITVPVLALAILGGARWWKAEDAYFQRTIYRPLAADALVFPDARGNVLRLAVSDTSDQDLLASPLMPDHGKAMHLFLVKDKSMSAFAHLHPTRDPKGIFETKIPAVPAGRYLVFADLALETGATYTATTSVDIPAAITDTTSDPDDSYVADLFGVPAAKSARAQLAPGLFVQWESADSLVAGKDLALSFTVRDRRDSVVPVEPYLGMVAHAILIRDDASVFVHLHPMGSMSMASMTAFELRNHGDTTADGRLANASGSMQMPAQKLDGRFSFPFAFPKPGRYKLWVQVKIGGRVQTADFELVVR
jgi:hypothetical protein